MLVPNKKALPKESNFILVGVETLIYISADGGCFFATPESSRSVLHLFNHLHQALIGQHHHALAHPRRSRLGDLN